MKNSDFKIHNCPWFRFSNQIRGGGGGEMYTCLYYICIIMKIPYEPQNTIHLPVNVAKFEVSIPAIIQRRDRDFMTI